MSIHDPIIDSVVMPQTFVEPLAFNEYDVTISVDSIVAIEYFEALYFELLALSSHSELRFTLEEISQYLKTIIYNRVLWVRKEPGRRYIFHASESIAMPSFINLCCNNIGKASRFGDSLVPQMFMENPMPLAKMNQISNYLKAFGRVGFQYAVGFDRKIEGDFAVMSLWCIENKVVSSDMEAHPSYGMLIAFLKSQVVENILLPKVSYGEFNYYSSRIGKLASADFTGQGNRS